MIHDILALFDIPAALLPQPRASATPVAKVSAAAARRCGLAAGTPVSVGAGDQSAGAVGAGIVRKGLVSVSMGTPRAVRLLPRGDWMDDSGEIMQPALPAFLPQPNVPQDRRLNRLDLAQWLVSRDNPLTARVFMNRLWKQFFGIGLSKVPEDLGSQGEWPVYPELLDWLACEFMDRGWDVKHMVRTIALSRTYRQVSTASKPLQERDPANRTLARQSRFRLDAELVRDNALSIAGLLAPKIGGPSVKPYQPDNVWETVAMDGSNTRQVRPPG